MQKRSALPAWVALSLLTLLTACVCVAVGSVDYPLTRVAEVLYRAAAGQAQESGAAAAIILGVRLPRVLCAALIGASLSLCGAAMQGLLRNPLADGSTLGVSSGAALGAALAILLGVTVPGLPLAGATVFAILFAFGSLVLILVLAWGLDHTMSTNSIILIGVIFSMFVSAVMNVLVTFAGDKLRSITFWTMGSMASAGMPGAALLAGTLAVCGTVLVCQGRALNAFAMGEEQALHIGVHVRGVKLTVMITVSVLIGVCVSVGGCIAFVGLVTPHILRMIIGPDHRRLLPASLFGGAIFLMLCDLAARTVLSPLELPIGVVTSLIGAVVFIVIFYRTGKVGRGAC